MKMNVTLISSSHFKVDKEELKFTVSKLNFNLIFNKDSEYHYLNLTLEEDHVHYISNFFELNGSKFDLEVTDSVPCNFNFFECEAENFSFNSELSDRLTVKFKKFQCV